MLHVLVRTDPSCHSCQLRTQPNPKQPNPKHDSPVGPSYPSRRFRAYPPAMGEEEGAVGELEEEEEGAVDEWEEEGAVDGVVSDSEEELEVLRQPGLIQKLATVVTQRASCVIELEGGAPLTIRPATQRRRPYSPPTERLPPAPLSTDHARDSTTVVVTALAE